MDTPTSPTIRVLTADDHPLVRAGIKFLIEQRSDMTVVGEASNGQEAVDQFMLISPDVVLMDLRMPEMDGVRAAERITSLNSKAGVIMLTSFYGDEDIYRALRSGAKGYILKDDIVEDLIVAIQEVSTGKRFLKSHILTKLADRIAGPHMTPRELEVLTQVSAGKTNRTIADQLFISEGTVKAHMKSILSKLGAADRTQAVTIAVKRSIVQLE